MRYHMVSFCCALALLAATAAVHAEVYKWTDANGQVHYSDQPQGSDNAPIVTPGVTPGSAPASPAGGTAAEQQRKLLNALTTERLEREEQQRVAKAERERRERNCQLARDQLRAYLEAGGLYDLDEQGERRLLTDTERSAAEDAVRTDVEKWCD